MALLPSSASLSAWASVPSAPKVIEKRLMTASLAGLPAGWAVFSRKEFASSNFGLPIPITNRAVVAAVQLNLRKEDTLGFIHYLITRSPSQALQDVGAWRTGMEKSGFRRDALPSPGTRKASQWLLIIPHSVGAVAVVGPVIVQVDPG